MGGVAVFGQVFVLSPWSPTATSASSAALPTAAAQRATLAAHCRHSTSGELITAQIGSEQLFMCTDGPYTHLLVDHIHPSQAVEAEAVQALLAWLVD